MPFKSKIRSLTLLSAVVLLGSSCGGGDSTTSSDLNPLEEALGLEDGFEGSFDQESVRRQEEAVAACMKEKGFEYEVSVPDVDVFEDLGDFESKEYAEEWGFGISTQAFSQEAVGPELKGHEFDQFEDESEDPNQKIVESLSDEEREDYEEALWGESFSAEIEEEDFSEDGEEEAEDFGLPEGCYGEALKDDPFFAVFEEIGEDLDKQYERMLADPDFKALDKKLADCISKSGSEVSNFEDYQEELSERVNKISSDVYGDEFGAEEDFGVDEDLDAEDLPDELTDDELPEGESTDDSTQDESFDDFEEPELTADQKAELGEIQTEELEVAVVVFECEEDGLREERQNIENKYLQEFVDKNKTTFDKHVKK